MCVCVCVCGYSTQHIICVKLQCKLRKKKIQKLLKVTTLVNSQHAKIKKKQKKNPHIINPNFEKKQKEKKRYKNRRLIILIIK